MTSRCVSYKLYCEANLITIKNPKGMFDLTVKGKLEVLLIFILL